MSAKPLKKNQGSVGILKVSMVWTILIALLAVLAVASMAIGSAGYSFREILSAIFLDTDATTRVVVLSLRLPRVILAILFGAALAAGGALLQAVMRNPWQIREPSACLRGRERRAITVLLIFPNLSLSLPLFAFVGASLACVLIYIMAWKGGCWTGAHYFVWSGY